ncbi:MAG: adenylyl-sulfate kinase [Desulfatiglans sp.]|jgi:adenylylsulfate kinase|nr:adenylyl-sulfate kinase [Desulfatiglans sp.]
MNFCIWVTGLPGSGKSTIVKELEQMLLKSDIGVLVLSMDRIRKILTPEPRYSDEERSLVYRALVLIAQLLMKNCGKSVIIDATGNRREFRELARQFIPEFAEIYVKCPLETCKMREALRLNRNVENNLYKKALQGKLKGQLPGISAPYEEPLNPELELASNLLSPRDSAKMIMKYIRSRWVGR